MEEDLTSLLLAAPAVADRIAGRLHWTIAPPGEVGFPYIICQVVAAPRDYHHGGETNVFFSRVQIDVYDDSALGRLQTARTVVATLSAYRGIVGGTNFRAIFLLSQRDMGAETNEGERRLFRRSIDFNIIWKVET